MAFVPDSPKDANAACRSHVPRYAASGGNSTMRNTVPLRGGARVIGLPQGSASLARAAGAPNVFHRSVTPKLSMPAMFIACGDGPSSRIVDRPATSCPVTIRRIGRMRHAVLTGALVGALMDALMGPPSPVWHGGSRVGGSRKRSIQL